MIPFDYSYCNERLPETGDHVVTIKKAYPIHLDNERNTGPALVVQAKRDDGVYFTDYLYIHAKKPTSKAMNTKRLRDLLISANVPFTNGAFEEELLINRSVVLHVVNLQMGHGTQKQVQSYSPVTQKYQENN